jgi:hypothetical protein
MNARTLTPDPSPWKGEGNVLAPAERDAAGRAA